MLKATTNPLPAPTTQLTQADSVTAGLPIPPIERIRIFSARQWEEFVLEWADSLVNEYESVERCGGAGDMGRDIVATRKDNGAEWDNFQCKHYRDPLSPKDIWLELAKLCYYTHEGAYTYPRRYYFVALQGAGTKLSNLLKKPDELRLQLFAAWDKYCKTKITNSEVVSLENDFKSYIAGLDFSIFEAIPPLRLIRQHKQTPWHVSRFGGGLPERPPADTPPTVPTQSETRYVRQLLGAYADHLNTPVSALADLKDERLRAHFRDARIEFYSAESLRLFSRDPLPPGTFESLKDEVHSGVSDEERADHDSGYKRVVAVVQLAKKLQITAHALISRLTLRDRGGICHQLANEDKVRWVRDK